MQPKWADQAACAGTDPVLFTGAGRETDAEHERRIAAAIQVCVSCPVMETCREQAILDQEYGVWGGTTDHQRAAIRRVRRQMSKAA